jgi:hypothetical protein
MNFLSLVRKKKKTKKSMMSKDRRECKEIRTSRGLWLGILLNILRKERAGIYSMFWVRGIIFDPVFSKPHSIEQGH